MTARWWRQLSTPARAILGMTAVLFGLAVSARALDTVTGGPEPGGPSSSSYATGPDGLAAYVDLLARLGHEVGRLREPLDRVRLDPSWSVVIADPRALTMGERAAVGRFVDGGGRLVLAGGSALATARELVTPDLGWTRRGSSTVHVLAPVAEVAQVRRVASAGEGAWTGGGPALPILGGRDSAVALVVDRGAGRVVLVADASIFQNRFLSAGDDAAFAAAAVGPTGRPVRFAEHAHGYTRGEGLGALPSKWRNALALAAVSAGVLMWARGRRFGRPEDTERRLPPPRRAYVDAVAATLAKTGDRSGASAAVRREARHRVIARAGLRDDAGDGDLRRAAISLGLADDEAAAIVSVPTTDEDVRALGRAFARLERSM